MHTCVLDFLNTEYFLFPFWYSALAAVCELEQYCIVSISEQQTIVGTSPLGIAPGESGIN